MSNIYYNPEAYNLENVAEFDFSSGNYEFDTLVVFRVKQGSDKDKLFWAQDSGCSCPTPFEGHSMESLERLHKRNFKYFEETVRGYSNYSGGDVDKFIREVEELVFKK